MKREGLIAGLTALSFSALATLMTWRKWKVDQRQAQIEEEQDDRREISEEHAELEQSRLLLMSLSSNIKVYTLLIEYASEGILTQRCLLNFCRQSTKSISDREVAEIYYQNRRVRRPHFPTLPRNQNSTEQYFKYVCLFDNEIQCLIEKSQKDLAVFLNLDYQVVSESINYYLSQDETNFRTNLGNLTVELREAIKKKLPTNREVSEETVREIIHFKIKTLKQDESKILATIESLELQQEEDQSYTPSFLCLYIEDKVFERFGLEQEDIVLGHKQLSVEQSRTLSQKFKEAQTVLIEKIFQLHAEI